MENARIDASVVIGFRDWGQERLKLSVKSILDSFGPYQGEVIVSDYGSKNTEGLQSEIEALGARYIYTPTDGPWSRSRALNAGFAHAHGEVLICTDADMLFSPRSMERIISISRENAPSCLLLQCRDLPGGYTHESDRVINPDWNELEAASKLRPRWGMGGMIAVSRPTFRTVQGLDERMHTYGGEDIDFAKRVRNTGAKVLWVEDPEVRMYHIFHPPTRNSISAAESVAVERNKKIVEADNTLVRNLKSWEFPLDDEPLVSVVISTFNRGDYISDSINSVLAQTFQNFEIIIVDDGSTDNTREVVESFADPRVRYFYQDNAGISAARNLAARESRGIYTAVHDDDDIMLPDRLENSLNAIRSGVRATFGSWVNFDDASAEMVLHVSKINFNKNTVYATGQAPGHPTWLLETALIREFKYDESLTSAVDNNLALRLMRAGIQWAHTGKVMVMRRIHKRQVSDVDSGGQKTGAKWSNQMLQLITPESSRDHYRKRAKQEKWPKLDERGHLEESFSKYLPDHLADRQVTVTGGPERAAGLIGKLSSVDYVLDETDLDGTRIGARARISGVTLADLVTLRKANFNFSLSGTLAVKAIRDPQRSSAVSESDALKTRIADILAINMKKWPQAAILLVSGLDADSTILKSGSASRAVIGRDFSFIGTDGIESRSVALGFTDPAQAVTEARVIKKSGVGAHISVLSGAQLGEPRNASGSEK
ncbi:glycosyltransferase [Haematomicrobium sanguinis]|uniref:glycosyltransferase n=1 Tax=Haematomicrobium sanguinis TaxID=479106 RepID=UPI000A07214C|nr:glycosyltransferase [Haematomicrobium sanguinis]